MSNTVKGWLCAIAGMVTMGVSHLCYSIIIILMASMVAAVGCSAAEGALIFSITAIGSLVASLFIGSLLKVLKTKYVYVIGGILQGALLVTMGYSTNLMLVYLSLIHIYCSASLRSMSDVSMSLRAAATSAKPI